MPAMPREDRAYRAGGTIDLFLSDMPAVSDERLRLSEERPTIRWAVLAVVWLLIAALVVTETFAVRDYIALLDDSGNLPTTSIPMHRTLAAQYSDVQQWTRLALEHDGGWQVRFTQLDNAPNGREVHWNSGLVHLIQFAGRIRAASTDEPIATATERALAWLNLPIFLSMLVLLSTWAARRAGVLAGVLIAIAMTGHRFFYDGFVPNNLDHHGLLNASALGLILGGAFMHAGWFTRDEDDIRSAAVCSAVWGAFGMWISAASIIPAVTLVGVGGVVAACVPADSEEKFSGRAWRTWGIVGGALSLLAYVVEYVPHHIEWRLEVNHPVYALAWAGGAELVALIGEKRARAVARSVWRWAIASIAVLLPAIIIAIGRARVFLPLDPELARLHSFIDEFNSLFAFARRFGLGYLARYLVPMVLVLPALLACVRRYRARRALIVAAVATAGLALLAVMQVRWWMAAGAAEIALILTAVVLIRQRVSERATWAAVALVSLAFAQQAVWRGMVTRHNVTLRAVTPADAMEPLFRDVAVTLRASQPNGDITLLSSPDAALGVSYYGGFKTIGTFYWENHEGLAAAARMFSAESIDSARAEIQARGVTHVALFSISNFLEQFLLAEGRPLTRETISRTFGYRLLVAGEVPRWLRPIPFSMRPGGPPTSVKLFQVVPDQSEFDVAWWSAVAKAAAGDSTSEAEFNRAIALRGANEHAKLLSDAARAVYAYGAHALALRLYKRSAALESSAQTTLAIAWILSTSPDDAIRDGRLALTLLDPVVRAYRDAPGVLDTYAAALAEAGQYPEAASAESAAMANAERAGDEAARARGEQRLMAYRAGHAWRQ
jgi:hypothetical protein